MKIYICIMYLAAVVSAFYPGDTKMVRLGVVTSEVAQFLYQKILMPSDKTSVFSPISVQMTLTNAVLGAKGPTVNEMYDVLQLTRFDGGQRKPHEAYSNLREQYSTNTTDGKVLVANGIYVSPNTSLNQKFTNATITDYKSDLSAHDLTNPQGPEQKVNEYFKTKTEGLIQNIVAPGSINSSTEIVLVSAFTVATTWLKPFDAKQTKNRPFYITSTTATRVPMLYDDARVIALKKNFHGADIAELPCHGNRYSMFILLPQYTSSLAEQEKSLTAVNRTKELFKGPFTLNRVTLIMPKIRIEATYELSSALKALGMVKAFDPTADFTAMSKTADRPYISKHIHKAVFEINENGTAAVAAAAYTDPFSPTLLDILFGPAPGTPLYLDHPFIFFFRDNLNNRILFQGKFTGK